MMSTRGKQKKRTAEALEKASEIVEKTPKVTVPKEPRVWPIPPTVIFNLVKRIAGSKAKYETYRKADLEWDQSYDEITAAWESRAGYKARGDARGSWSHTLTIGLHEETKPVGIASELTMLEDWEVYKAQVMRLTSTTGKVYAFTITWTFKALALDTGITTTPAASQRDSSSRQESYFTSPTPFGTPPSTLTPRESVTSRREGTLDAPAYTLSQAMLQIQRTNACRQCSGRTWCYVPVPGGKHLHLSGKGLTLWSQALVDGRCTEHKPPEDLPELVQWAKLNLVKTKSKKKHSKKSHRRRTPSTTTSEDFSSDSAHPAGLEFWQDPQEADSQAAVPASSPPCDNDDPYENIQFWIDYAVDQYTLTAGFKSDTIVARCRSAYMTFKQIREILKDAKLEPWAEVREFGIERGIAAVMHCELRPWELSFKSNR